MEELIGFLAEDSLKTILLRAPYLADGESFCGWLGKLFSDAREKHEIFIPYPPEDQADFLSVMDLTELLILVSEESADKTASFNVTGDIPLTYGELAGKLKELEPELEVSFGEKRRAAAEVHSSRQLQYLYGFTPADNVSESIADYYRNYVQQLEKKNPAAEALKKAGRFLMKRAVVWIEVVLFGILMEILVRYTGDSVYFQYADIRLFYVLLLGSVHGMAAGLAAGMIACVSVIFSFAKTGINGTMLFYNMNYWLPFVLYLMTGLITGYIRSVSLQNLAFRERETKLITDKYLFLSDVYEGLMSNKRRYKEQIISYQDSFGKIYESVHDLDSLLPEEIFSNGITVLEKALNNHSIAIYMVGKNTAYGRLIANSIDLRGSLKMSFRLEDYPEMVEVLKQGGVWRNTDFQKDMPVYACGVNDSSRLRIVVMLYHAEPEQQALYYTNLFQVICNLIHIAFLRALDYQSAIEEKKYYPGTRILYPEYYEEVRRNQKQMAEKNISSFIEILLDTRDREEVDAKIETSIRDTDYCGCDRDGNIYILLTQTDEKTFVFVEKRLNKLFTYKRVKE